MNDLLQTAIEAHGGLERWRQATRLRAHANIGGGLWGAKGKAGFLSNVRIDVDPHRQHVEYAPFGAPGQYSVYEPGRVSVETDSGQVLESRDDPRAAFKGHARETQWDNLDLAYFSGYAIWTYLTTPFLFVLPGFVTAEMEPWTENHEVWRRLRVVFPADVASHSTEQVFYFDAGGILRRQDYSADVLGGLPSANYAYDPKQFDGLVIPTRRRVFARRTDNQPATDRIAVAIDIQDIEVTSG